MSKRVDELEGAELNHWTALADGYEFRGSADDALIYGIGNDTVRGRPNYVGDWTWCGPLIERFDISIGTRPMGPPWEATCIFDNDISGGAYDPKTAICRAVVASVYGEEMPDD